MICNSFIWIYILPVYLISPMLSISLNSWFSIWISIEINLMSFIPLMMFMNQFYKELLMKYFIIQVISSTMIIISSNLILINNIMLNNWFIYLINISLMIKLGMPPFHNWFINLMKNLNWLNCFLLSTWQKIIPLFLLMYNPINNFIYLMMINSSLTSMFGINHQSLRIILSYSSINHLSWLLMNLMISENLMILYFINYMIMNISIMSLLYKFKFNYINNINNFNNYNLKIFLIMNLFSMSSMPPMLGFMMKWFSIYYNLTIKLNFILLLLMMMSLFSFYFYMKISLTLLLNFNFKNKLLMFTKIFYIKNINYFMMTTLISFMNIWIMNIWIM